MFSQYQINLAVLADAEPTSALRLWLERGLEQAGAAIGVRVQAHWLGGESLGRALEQSPLAYDGVCCAASAVDAEPVRAVIAAARRQGVPFLGIAQGFYLALEDILASLPARLSEHVAVRGLAAQLSAEVAPVISRKAWPNLLELREVGATRLRRYGLSVAPVGRVHAFELADHPFFIASAVQPDPSHPVPPLLAGLVGACAVQRLHEAQMQVAV